MFRELMEGLTPPCFGALFPGFPFEPVRCLPRAQTTEVGLMCWCWCRIYVGVGVGFMLVLVSDLFWCWCRIYFGVGVRFILELVSDFVHIFVFFVFIIVLECRVDLVICIILLC